MSCGVQGVLLRAVRMSRSGYRHVLLDAVSAHQCDRFATCDWAGGRGDSRVTVVAVGLHLTSLTAPVAGFVDWLGGYYYPCTSGSQAACYAVALLRSALPV